MHPGSSNCRFSFNQGYDIMSLWDYLCIGPLGGLVDSFVKNVFCDPVDAQRGSIVRCDLLCGRADHTGVYLGNGRIAELDGDGNFREVSPTQFLSDSHVRTGVYIYVACDSETEQPLYREMTAIRAEAMLGRKSEYNLLCNNCHEFVSGCITGDFDNAEAALWMLEATIMEHLNDGNTVCWRSWDLWQLPASLPAIPGRFSFFDEKIVDIHECFSALEQAKTHRQIS